MPRTSGGRSWKKENIANSLNDSRREDRRWAHGKASQVCSIDVKQSAGVLPKLCQVEVWIDREHRG